jgi:hypothetical protein
MTLHQEPTMLIVAAIILLRAGAGIYFLSFLDTPSTTPAPLAAEMLEKLPQNRKGQVLIYSAYGFSGSGISRLAAEYGITPVLAYGPDLILGIPGVTQLDL